jgi:hypothetical protein
VKAIRSSWDEDEDDKYTKKPAVPARRMQMQKRSSGTTGTSPAKPGSLYSGSATNSDASLPVPPPPALHTSSSLLMSQQNTADVPDKVKRASSVPNPPSASSSLTGASNNSTPAVSLKTASKPASKKTAEAPSGDDFFANFGV